MAHDLVTELLQYSSLACFMPIWHLCANLLIPNCLRSNLSYSPLAALELYVNACNSKPDLSEHKKKVANEVVKCTKDEIKSTTSAFIPGLENLASNLIDGSINDDNVKNMFFRNNSLELKDSWYWNRGILYNSYNPEGTTVSFGICGFVIPLVEWEDFKLMEE